MLVINGLTACSFDIISSLMLLSLVVNCLGVNARKPIFMVYKQQRLKPACASVQTDLSLCYSLFGT